MEQKETIQSYIDAINSYDYLILDAEYEDGKIYINNGENAFMRYHSFDECISGLKTLTQFLNDTAFMMNMIKYAEAVTYADQKVKEVLKK